MKSAENNLLPLLPGKLNSLIIILFFPIISLCNDSITTKQNAHLQLNGYIKDIQSVFLIDNPASLITGNFLHNRINFRWNFSDKLYMRIESRNRLYYGEQVKSTYQYGKYIDVDNGLLDLSCNLVDDTSVVINTMLDRALLNWSDSKWDISIGRQRINWGVNLVWNPNDIFNAFNYFDFDYEERPGSDAFRIQYNTGNSSLIELAYKLSDKEKEQVGAIMYKTNFKKYDWQNFSGIYYQNIVLGTGWAGNIQNTGFKGEVSYFHPYKALMDTNGILSASISIDRSFKHNYFAMASYLYNSEGKGLQNGISELTGAPLSAKKLMPFKHSFFAQLSKSFNPLLNGSIAFMISPQKKSLILLPTFSVSISDNWDVAFVGQSFFSEVNGVYRTLGNGIYLRLKWSY